VEADSLSVDGYCHFLSDANNTTSGGATEVVISGHGTFRHAMDTMALAMAFLHNVLFRQTSKFISLVKSLPDKQYGRY